MCPPGGQNPYPRDHQIYNFGRGLPALHHYHLVSLRHVRLLRRRFLKICHFWAVFAPPPRPQGCKRFEIYNLGAPCPKDASYQI